MLTVVRCVRLPAEFSTRSTLDSIVAFVRRQLSDSRTALWRDIEARPICDRLCRTASAACGRFDHRRTLSSPISIPLIPRVYRIGVCYSKLLLGIHRPEIGTHKNRIRNFNRASRIYVIWRPCSLPIRSVPIRARLNSELRMNEVGFLCVDYE